MWGSKEDFLIGGGVLYETLYETLPILPAKGPGCQVEIVPKVAETHSRPLRHKAYIHYTIAIVVASRFWG